MNVRITQPTLSFFFICDGVVIGVVDGGGLTEPSDRLFNGATTGAGLLAEAESEHDLRMVSFLTAIAEGIVCETKGKEAKEQDANEVSV